MNTRSQRTLRTVATASLAFALAALSTPAWAEDALPDLPATEETAPSEAADLQAETGTPADLDPEAVEPAPEQQEPAPVGEAPTEVIESGVDASASLATAPLAGEDPAGPETEPETYERSTADAPGETPIAPLHSGSPDDPVAGESLPWVSFNTVGAGGSTAVAAGQEFLLEYSCGTDSSDEQAPPIVSCVEASGVASGTLLTLEKTPENGGVYTWTVTATNAAGKTATLSRSITVVERGEADLDAYLSALSGNLEGWNNHPVQLEVTAYANHGELPTYPGARIAVNGGIWYSTTMPAIRHTISAEGMHRVHYSAGGGASPTRTQALKIDLTDPVINVDHGGLFDGSTPPVLIRGSEVEVSYDCADALSGIRDCTSELVDDRLLDTSSLGNHTVAFTAFDEAGNETVRYFDYAVAPGEDRISLSYTSETPERDGWYSSPMKGVVRAVTTGAEEIDNIYMTVGNGWGRYDGARATMQLDSEGEFLLQAYAMDTAGAVSDTFERTIRIDMTDPEIRSDLEPGRTFRVGERFLVTPSCTDALSGVRVCPEPFWLDTSAEGEFDMYLVAHDIAGNERALVVPYSVVASDGTGDPDGNGGSGTNGSGNSGGAQPGTGEQPQPVRESTPTLARTGSGYATPIIIGGGAALAAAGLAFAIARKHRLR